MSRILLADDSPHAQRMGERILREEGYEVVTVTDGNTALLRLPDVDPDVVFVDVSLPSHSGYEICKRIKSSPRHAHVRVILTAGFHEAFDENQAKEAGCDGVLKKPFESSVVLDTVKPLVAAAVKDRKEPRPAEAKPEAAAESAAASPETPKPEPEARPFIEPAARVGVMRSMPLPVSSVASITTTPVSNTTPQRLSGTPPAIIASEKRSAEVARIQQVFEGAPRAVPVRILTEPVPPEGVATRAAQPGIPEPDAERIRAAVTVALDAALPGIIEKITEQVLIALRR